MEEENWKEIKSSFWKPEKVGETLTGKLLGTEETNYGEAYRVETEVSVFLVNYTALKNKLKNIAVGTKVKIEFLGMKTSEKGMKYKNFKVYTA